MNHMRGTKSPECNKIARKIWDWCEEREVWVLAASHVPGVLNVLADEESRHFVEDTQWRLNPSVFQSLVKRWGLPTVDFFASRLTNQVPVYVIWFPDPEASFIDAFSIKWNQFELSYLFPAFRLMTRCLQKIRAEKACGGSHEVGLEKLCLTAGLC